ncbi:8137_t:CDS:1, partial [Ambispora gerdemannii]
RPLQLAITSMYVSGYLKEKISEAINKISEAISKTNKPLIDPINRLAYSLTKHTSQSAY